MEKPCKYTNDCAIRAVLNMIGDDDKFCEECKHREEDDESRRIDQST